MVTRQINPIAKTRSVRNKFSNRGRRARSLFLFLWAAFLNFVLLALTCSWILLHSLFHLRTLLHLRLLHHLSQFLCFAIKFVRAPLFFLFWSIFFFESIFTCFFLGFVDFRWVVIILYCGVIILSTSLCKRARHCSISAWLLIFLSSFLSLLISLALFR